MSRQTDSRLLLVDDDEVFCQVLAKALGRRHFTVDVAHGADEVDQFIDRRHAFAILDLNMPGGSGLTLIPRLLGANEHMAIVVLTGYASIQTAVEAIKLGARHYLTKPADADQIVEALHQVEGNTEVMIKPRPTSVNRLEWEHIQKVLAECDGNISEAARQLGMHRRTLQRKLQKRPSPTD